MKEELVQPPPPQKLQQVVVSEGRTIILPLNAEVASKLPFALVHNLSPMLVQLNSVGHSQIHENRRQKCWEEAGGWGEREGNRRSRSR